jgi:hypothetical protein
MRPSDITCPISGAVIDFSHFQTAADRLCFQSVEAAAINTYRSIQ